MQPIYHQIRKRARQIILRHPAPDFYHDHSPDYEASRQFFDGDRIIKKLLSFVAATLEDDFGHGLMHAVKVSHDAGTLMVIEARQSGRTTPRTALCMRRKCLKSIRFQLKKLTIFPLPSKIMRPLKSLLMPIHPRGS
jgi:hypothetical protein